MDNSADNPDNTAYNNTDNPIYKESKEPIYKESDIYRNQERSIYNNPKTCQTCAHSVPRVSIAVGFRPYCSRFHCYRMLPCIDWRSPIGYRP